MSPSVGGTRLKAGSCYLVLANSLPSVSLRVADSEVGTHPGTMEGHSECEGQGVVQRREAPGHWKERGEAGRVRTSGNSQVPQT